MPQLASNSRKRPSPPGTSAGCGAVPENRRWSMHAVETLDIPHTPSLGSVRLTPNAIQLVTLSN